MAPVFCAIVDVHHARLGGGVGQDLGVDAALDLADLASVTGALCAKSKRVRSALTSEPFCCTWRPALRAGLVHQVGDRVVAHGGGAAARC
jgi:hypothetical protein